MLKIANSQPPPAEAPASTANIFILQWLAGKGEAEKFPTPTTRASALHFRCHFTARKTSGVSPVP